MISCRASILIFLGTLSILYGGGSVAVLAQEPLPMFYDPRPLYAYKDADGKVKGGLIQAVEPVLKRAGISFKWVEVPFNRQLKVVEDNHEAVCAAGLFVTPERKRFAKFTMGVFQDVENLPVVLAHHEFTIPPGLEPLQILSIPNARLLRKENASYGPYMDDLFQKSNVKQVTTSAEPITMAKMLLARRADFLVTSEQEAKLMMQEVAAGDKLYIRKLPGSPHQVKRHIMCSLKVSDETIQKINRAIEK